MRHLVFALALLGATVTGAQAQTAIPDLKGTWSGKGKSIVFGSHAHHPGSQTPNDPPRVRDIEATYVVEGQDGRLVWGRSASAVADTKEPFAWAISSDNKTIVGADMDGASSRPIGWRSATPTTPWAAANRWSPPATRWTASASPILRKRAWRGGHAPIVGTPAPACGARISPALPDR